MIFMAQEKCILLYQYSSTLKVSITVLVYEINNTLKVPGIEYTSG